MGGPSYRYGPIMDPIPILTKELGPKRGPELSAAKHGRSAQHTSTGMRAPWTWAAIHSHHLAYQPSGKICKTMGSEWKMAHVLCFMIYVL